MGKKVNVQKGKQGFQPTTPQAVSPQGAPRGFLSRLFNRNSSPGTKLYQDQSSTHNDDWGNGGYDYFAEVSSNLNTGSNDSQTSMQADSSEYRFGPHAVAHANIDTKRQEVLASLSESQSYDAPGENGKRQQISLNFNPAHTRPLIDNLAYKVLEESGYFDRGESKYRGVRGVYSQETVRCAERIYKAEGRETFLEQKHDKESTSIFPSEVSKTPDSVSYKYYIHPDVSTLVHGVEKDQKSHVKLQAEISDHQNRATTKSQARSSFDLNDW
jgi:hypothetical protein